MGIIEGSKIHWTHAVDADPNHIYGWYCQQHKQNKLFTSFIMANAFAALKTQIKDTHGCNEQ